MKMLVFLLCFLLLPLSPQALLQAPPDAPVLRALLIACDDFVSQPDTAPSSYNNVTNIRRALLQDIRAYRAIKVVVNQALDQDSFALAAREAFAGAKENDISFVYISTHGLRGEADGDFEALMSDGVVEISLSGAAMQRALKSIPGVKALILDACFSGAAILKGMDQPRVSSPFTGNDFKVLCSAGGSEPSFLWTDGLGTVQGGSYFAEALVDGISARGRYAADANRDGSITLEELHAWSLGAYGASTPQAYPENDPFVMFAYDAARNTGDMKAVTDVLFESRVMKSPKEPLVFSYTLHEPSYLAYQLVYQQEGAWRFLAPQSIAQEEKGDLLLQPGRKEAALLPQPGLPGLSGYLLMFIITVQEDRARPQACVLLSVQTKEGDPDLRVDTAPLFCPENGEEAAFVVRHKGPVILSARVEDSGGNLVKTLLYESPSRPTQLENEGTGLFWNGKTETGAFAPPGRYRLLVTAWSGTLRYDAAGEYFTLGAGEASSPYHSIPSRAGCPSLKGCLTASIRLT